MESTISDLKTAAHQLVDELPPHSTWDDLQYRIYVRQAIEAGLADADAGRVVDVAEVRKQFGLPS